MNKPRIEPQMPKAIVDPDLMKAPHNMDEIIVQIDKNLARISTSILSSKKPNSKLPKSPKIIMHEQITETYFVV